MRRYSNTAVQTTLSSGVTAGATTIPVTAVTGFPAVDFVLALDADQTTQELVLVTGVSSLNLTVVRGYDNTTAVSHDAGAVVRHSHAAIDFREAREHEAAVEAHGANGAVVGTNNAQTFINKTINLANNTVSGTIGEFQTALTDADFVYSTGWFDLSGSTTPATGWGAPSEIQVYRAGPLRVLRVTVNRTGGALTTTGPLTVPILTVSGTTDCPAPWRIPIVTTNTGLVGHATWATDGTNTALTLSSLLSGASISNGHTVTFQVTYALP